MSATQTTTDDCETRVDIVDFSSSLRVRTVSSRGTVQYSPYCMYCMVL